MPLVLSSFPASESSEQLSAWLELKWTKTGEYVLFSRLILSALIALQPN